MEYVIDHLWQSVWFVLLIQVLAWLVHANGATLRLWLWRAAALKFLVPLSLLHALGAWIGFPVRHSVIPPPDAVTRAAASIEIMAAPVQTQVSSAGVLAGSFALVLALALLCAALIRREWLRARTERLAEESRELLGEGVPAPLGFFKSTTLSASAFVVLVAPMFVGAVQDRLQRQAALAHDARSLGDARIALTEVPHQFGGRTLIHADAQGVTIRYINLQDLVALVYGLGKFEIYGGAMPWLEHPHYDVRIAGRLSSPDIFDAYSLRMPVTQYLHDQYGVSIRVNGDCQDPCLNQESIVVERIPWLLSKMMKGEKIAADQPPAH
jgi:hypothetical protein